MQDALAYLIGNIIIIVIIIIIIIITGIIYS